MRAKFSYYVCGNLNKKRAGSCPSRYFNSQKFEESVIKAIRENILTEEHMRRLVRLVNEEIDGNSKHYQDKLKAVLEESELTEKELFLAAL